MKGKLGQPSKGNQEPREISIKANTIQNGESLSILFDLRTLTVPGILANADLLGKKEK